MRLLSWWRGCKHDWEVVTEDTNHPVRVWWKCRKCGKVDITERGEMGS